MTRNAATPRPIVGARARALAARLAALFETDRKIVVGLSDAQHRLLSAGDRLSWLPGTSDAHQQLHSAFSAYQQGCEQRRQLAVDVGELSQQLTDTLTAAGYSAEQARRANVHELAAGRWRVTAGSER